MQKLIDKATLFFETPIDLRSRFLIMLAALILLPTFFSRYGE